ncbi:MAG TPA: SigE family RNA polymerase sigma factor [Actinomycetota bacterium]|nr:SigE family RNA polymerase sigma factor [Actinomycetota bacterium]
MFQASTATAAPSDEAAAGGRFAELYDAHALGAVRLAYLLTGDRELAEDIAQDAFIKVVGRFHDLRHRDAFGAYLRIAIVNLVRSHFRRRKLERAHVASERARVARGDDQPPDIAGRDALRRALLALPVRQRAAVVLRYFEDLSEQQTGDALGCSPAAVKALVARAMETLRRPEHLSTLQDGRTR